MKSLFKLSAATKAALKNVFAVDEIVKSRTNIQSFPKIKNFFALKDLQELEIIIVNGTLYKSDELIYGAYFRGTEEVQKDLLVKKNNSFFPFSVAVDRPTIVLGDMHQYLLETTLVHEIFHYITPNHHSDDYMSDPDEMEARDEERKFLAKYYEMSTRQIENFMEKKYLQ